MSMILKRYYGGYHEVTRAEGGVKSTTGWGNVEQALKGAGIVREDEKIIQLELDADGFTFTVEKIDAETTA